MPPRRTDDRATRATLPNLDRLEGRRLPSGLIAQGAGPGRPPEVQVLDADTGAVRLRFAAYVPGMGSGVRVAVGDVDGDGSPDILTATGPGAIPEVKAFRSTDGSMIASIALPRGWAGGGAWIAAGDVNGDGRADVVAAPGRGSAEVRVYDGVSGRLEESFRAGAASGAWSGGAKVAVGDVTRDGYADIVATPASGQSVVAVFDGRTGSAIARYRAFAGASGGRTSLAVGDLDGDRRLEVVAGAGRGGAATLKAFSGASGALVGRFVVAKAAGGSGVQVAAVNLGGRGADELAVSPSGGRGAGAAVLASSPFTLSAGMAAPPVAYRLPTSARGSFLAGDNSVSASTPAVAVGSIEPPLSQALPVIQRLAYFDPTLQQFVPVQANDPRLVGKDITVISHGWAPGYQAWVNHEATANNHVLTWWETFPGQPGYDTAWVQAHPQGPASAFLLDGVTASTIFGTTEVSATGLAQTILARTLLGTKGPADSNAAVLAYSWIDDSATPTWDFLHVSVPEEAYKSEALTTLNGERLAAGLEQVLGSSFAGKIQLAGHSHGSKVVSVASVALQQAGLPVDQVTILDSPEDDVTVVGDAANFNWYALQNLTGMDRSKGLGPLVDNVISEFGLPYSGIAFSGSAGGANLSQVVDVKLSPDVYYSYDAGDRHGYAPAWYTGSGEPSLTYGQTVGQYWSPLLPANAGKADPVPTLPSYAEQNWGEIFHSADQQFVLNPQSSAPTETISFEALDAPPVGLTQSGTMISSLPVSLRAPYYGQSGIAFDYQFPASQAGDRLVILDGSKPAFVMDAALVGTGVNSATLSLSAASFESHALTFVLTSTTSNTTSRVVVSNFRTFEQPLT